MTDPLPAPLTTSEVDVRGYHFMPLFGDRLFNSDFYAMASDLEFRVALKLWWTAWQSCPAGSLPNDDRALCRMADLGRDIRTWNRIKEAVLHGFLLCGDGRLYHKVICDEALKAYEGRRKERVRKAKLRQAKAAGQNGQPIEYIDDDCDLSVGQGVGHPGPCPTEIGSDRTGQDRTIREEGLSSTTTPPISPPPEAESATVREPMRTDVLPVNAPLYRWEGQYPWFRRPDDPDAILFDPCNPVAAIDYAPGEKGKRRFFIKTCRDIAAAAGFRPSHADRWEIVKSWLDKGYNVDQHILPAIREAAADYPKRIRSLAFFVDAVERFKRQSAA